MRGLTACTILVLLVRAGLAQSDSAQDTRYLGFQIFTYYSPDPKVAALLNSGSKGRLLPGTAALRDYVRDIETRIGTVVDARTHLAACSGRSVSSRPTPRPPGSSTWPSIGPSRGVALMKTLDERLKANKLEEVEKTADAILELLSGGPPGTHRDDR